jgi:uncharacterized membrane protein (UPF0127 family)
VRFALLAALFVGACSTGAKHDDAPVTPKAQPPADATVTTPPQPTAKVYLSTPNGEAAVNVEVVSTEAKIERGLMWREHMPLDNGMLFLMGFEKDWTFWMRNTLIPLDMIFIKKDMTVGGIVENAEPKTETLRKVGVPTFYVLEVNGGWCKQHGVVAGAKVRYENVPGA